MNAVDARWSGSGQPVANEGTAGAQTVYRVGTNALRPADDQDVIARLATGIIVVAAFVAAILLPGSGLAQEPATAVIQVQDAELDGSTQGGMSLVEARIPEGAALSAFDIVLSFDSNVVAPLDVNPSLPGIQVTIDRFWAQSTETHVEKELGEIRVAGSSTAVCSDSCLLFMVAWKPVAVGQSAVTVSEFSIEGPGIELFEVEAHDGVASVVGLPDASISLESVPYATVLSAGSHGWAVWIAGGLFILGIAAVAFAPRISKLVSRKSSASARLTPSEEASITALFDHLESDVQSVERSSK